MRRPPKPLAPDSSATPEASGDVLGPLVQLQPGAYWRVYRDESLAFKFACIYLMFEYVRPQSIWTVIDILPFGLVTLAGGVAIVWASPAERSMKTRGSLLPLLFTFLGVAVLSI